MRAFHALASEPDLQDAVARSQAEAVVLFKHSVTCPVSARAQQQMEAVAAQTPVYQLIVQQARPLSHQIAQTYGIRHESPQVLVLYRGAVVFHASHFRVTADAVRQAAAGAGTLSP